MDNSQKECVRCHRLVTQLTNMRDDVVLAPYMRQEQFFIDEYSNNDLPVNLCNACIREMHLRRLDQHVPNSQNRSPDSSMIGQIQRSTDAPDFLTESLEAQQRNGSSIQSSESFGAGQGVEVIASQNVYLPTNEDEINALAPNNPRLQNAIREITSKPMPSTVKYAKIKQLVENIQPLPPPPQRETSVNNNNAEDIPSMEDYFNNTLSRSKRRSKKRSHDGRHLSQSQSSDLSSHNNSRNITPSPQYPQTPGLVYQPQPSPTIEEPTRPPPPLPAAAANRPNQRRLINVHQSDDSNSSISSNETINRPQVQDQRVPSPSLSPPVANTRRNSQKSRRSTRSSSQRIDQSSSDDGNAHSNSAAPRRIRRPPSPLPQAPSRDLRTKKDIQGA